MNVAYGVVFWVCFHYMVVMFYVFTGRQGIIIPNVHYCMSIMAINIRYRSLVRYLLVCSLWVGDLFVNAL